MDAMGCMLLRECTDNVDKCSPSLTYLRSIQTQEFTFVAKEFNAMITALNAVGVKVFLADRSISQSVTVVCIIL